MGEKEQHNEEKPRDKKTRAEQLKDMRSWEELVKRAQKGDQDAFATLFMQFRQHILQHLMKIVRNPEIAEDLTQDCYFKSWRSILSLAQPVRIEGWLLSVARHLALDYKRRQKLELKHNVELDSQKHDSGDKDAHPEETTIAKEIIVRALTELKKPRWRAIIVMVAVGYTIAEIALHFGYSENSLRSLISQIQKKLRKIRAEQEEATSENRKEL